MGKRVLMCEVREIRERAKKSRQLAQQLRARAESLKADAKRALERFEELDRAVATRAMRGTAVEGKSTRDLALHELSKSLQQLETLRMTPANDSALMQLKRDIRKTIRRAGKQ